MLMVRYISVTPQLAQGWNFSVAGNAVVSFYVTEIRGQGNNSKKPIRFKRLAFIKSEDFIVVCYANKALHFGQLSCFLMLSTTASRVQVGS